jgi:hypothetical protein
VKTFRVDIPRNYIRMDFDTKETWSVRTQYTRLKAIAILVDPHATPPDQQKVNQKGYSHKMKGYCSSQIN